jgi:hypothetical protein
MALALTVVQAADLSLAHRIASGEYVSPAAVAAADRHLRLVAGLTLLADIVCAVAFIAWLWRAYTNAQVLTGGSDHGRGWTVGAWFVPLVNLVLPCLLVREAWRRTAGRGGELVLWWWALYAGPGTLALVVFATVPRTSVQLIELRQVAGLAADSCGAIAAALAVVMVWQLTALQAGGAGSSAVAGAGPGAGPAGSGSALDPVA